MRTFVAAFFIATVVAAALTPLVRLLAFRLGAVAVPGERHIHKRSTPHLGGVAIFVAFVAALCSLFFVDTGVVVAVLAFSYGFRIDEIYLPYLGTAQMGVFALTVTVFWIVGIANAVNLIDGLADCAVRGRGEHFPENG